MIGRTLSHYEIREPLGSGGMGDVYRAHDTTLGRDVAIKVLPEDLADDPDRLARLKREAHLLAALNHPNVATIFGFEESEGTRFLVMELVKGESLEQRLAGGALPVDESLGICRQIAEALEAAHEEGIIHRDLKPANVLITPEGRVKVLDFGLAKTVERDTRDADLSHSPTLTIAATEAGVILGTAPYMSPEQVRGQSLDKRTDIWAFGCVLYETLAGSRAFNRETVADTLAAILEVDPPWDALPSTTPATVRALLQRCLQKDPKLRLRDIGDAWVDIETTLTGPMPAVPGVEATDIQRPLLQRALPWAVIGVAVGALIASVVVWNVMHSVEDVRYTELNLVDGTYLWGGSPAEARIGGNRPSRVGFALTPDGRTVVYAATDGNVSHLYRRDLDESGNGVPIAGAEGGWGPVISPDGLQVAFVVLEETGPDNRLVHYIRIVPIEGGDARTLVEGAGPFSMSWVGDWIAYSRGSEGIARVSTRGGAPVQISEPDPGTELSHAHPQLLPGGNAFLYTVLKARFEWRNADIMAQRIGEEPKPLIENAADARYLPTEHVLFTRDGVLWAAGFDPERLEFTTDPVRIPFDVMQSADVMNMNISTGLAQFSFSDSGSLLFARGGPHPQVAQPLVWVRLNGDDIDVQPLADVPPGTVLPYFMRISPDGTQVAYSGPKPVYNRGIVVLDLESGGFEQRDLPLMQTEPVWSPDGSRLAFVSEHEGARNIYWLPTNDLQTAEPQTITNGDAHKYVADWSVNNVLLYLQDEGPESALWTIDFSVDGPPTHFKKGWLAWATFSPDGKWVAYCTRVPPRRQVWVTPYPGPGRDYRVSDDAGGCSPAWSRDEKTLFYRTGRDYRQKMMAVDVDLTQDPPIVPGTRRELFDRYMGGSGEMRGYDVSPDGRLLMFENRPHPDQRVTTLVLVQNWFEELKQLVPTGR